LTSKVVQTAKEQPAAVTVIPSSETVVQSILRPTSHESEFKTSEFRTSEPAPLPVEPAATPILITTRPAPVVADAEIPSNPLRP
jgi:hypothetical protein